MAALNTRPLADRPVTSDSLAVYGRVVRRTCAGRALHCGLSGDSRPGFPAISGHDPQDLPWPAPPPFRSHRTKSQPARHRPRLRRGERNIQARAQADAHTSLLTRDKRLLIDILAKMASDRYLLLHQERAKNVQNFENRIGGCFRHPVKHVWRSCLNIMSTMNGGCCCETPARL